MIFVIVGVLILLVLYVISLYNTMQSLQTQIQASIQEIGNQLKRQASLLPNLEAAVKGHFKQEKDIYQMLTDARKSVSVAGASNKASDVDQAIEKLNNVVPRLNVAIESNPELKSDVSVNKFMNEMTDTADKMSYARRALIDLSQRYNQMLVVFPSNIIAGMFGFKPEKGLATPTTGAHLEVSDDETKDVKVSL